MKLEDIKSIAAAYATIVEKKSCNREELDPVDKKAVKKDFEDRKDKDIDNDGEVDSTDKYLHKKRKAISKSVDKEEAPVTENEKVEESVEVEEEVLEEGVQITEEELALVQQLMADLEEAVGKDGPAPAKAQPQDDDEVNQRVKKMHKGQEPDRSAEKENPETAAKGDDIAPKGKARPGDKKEGDK